MGRSLLILLAFVQIAQAKTTPIQTVKVGLLEALAISSSTSSERYRRAFEAAVYYTLGENEKRLNRCGYKFQISPAYYETGDRTSPKNAADLLDKEGTWIVFGPRRSDDFLLTAPALKHTAMVSPMANSLGVYKLGSPFFSMYPRIDEFSKVVLKVLEGERYGKRYGFLIDATNPTAIDFETEFDSRAKPKGYQKIFSVDVAGDEPDLTKLFAALKRNPIDFLALPSNSKQAGYTIAKVSAEFPNVKFVGTSGWGDNYYGFVSRYGIPESTQGFCIRQGRDVPVMKESLGVRSLDYDWNGEHTGPHFTGLSAIHFIRTLVDDLCSSRPKSKDQFLKQLATFRPDHFSTKEGFSVFKISKGKLVYGYEVEKTAHAKLAE